MERYLALIKEVMDMAPLGEVISKISVAMFADHLAFMETLQRLLFPPAAYDRLLQGTACQ